MKSKEIKEIADQAYKGSGFGTRETIQEAYEYAYDLLIAEGISGIYALTALNVLCNTISIQLIKANIPVNGEACECCPGPVHVKSDVEEMYDSFE